MTNIKLTWKFSNGKRGSKVVTIEPGIYSEPVRWANWLSAADRFIPSGSRIVNWSCVVS